MLISDYKLMHFKIAITRSGELVQKVFPDREKQDVFLEA